MGGRQENKGQTGLPAKFLCFKAQRYQASKKKLTVWRKHSSHNWWEMWTYIKKKNLIQSEQTWKQNPKLGSYGLDLWRSESQFSSAVWVRVGYLCSRGWCLTPVHILSALNGSSQWIVKKEEEGKGGEGKRLGGGCRWAWRSCGGAGV